MITDITIGLLMLVNNSRTAAHMPVLRENAVLTERAQMRADALCKTGQFSHDGLLAYFAGIKFRRGGENLAKDFADATSTHAALMASPTHQANILKKEYTDIGIGSACGITVELFIEAI